MHAEATEATRAEVLIAEDLEPLQELLQRAFEDEGYMVHAACNAAEAKAIFMDHANIRLIVSDLGMGGGTLNGDALHRAIKDELTVRRGVFILTSGGSDQYAPGVAEYINREKIPFVPKPYMTNAIVGAGTSLLRQIGRGIPLDGGREAVSTR